MNILAEKLTIPAGSVARKHIVLQFALTNTTELYANNYCKSDGNKKGKTIRINLYKILEIRVALK